VRLIRRPLHELSALNWKLANMARLKKISPKRFATQRQLLVEHFDATSD